MAQKKAKKYDPSKVYGIGDIIEHPHFKDTGEVIEIGITTDGYKKMVVNFPNVGKKRLVMDYKKSKK